MKQRLAWRHPARRTAARAAAICGLLVVAIAGCGDDDANDETPEVPVVTNEMGVETFEPTDDPFGMPATVEPEENS